MHYSVLQNFNTDGLRPRIEPDDGALTSKFIATSSPSQADWETMERGISLNNAQINRLMFSIKIWDKLRTESSHNTNLMP